MCTCERNWSTGVSDSADQFSSVDVGECPVLINTRREDVITSCMKRQSSDGSIVDTKDVTTAFQTLSNQDDFVVKDPSNDTSLKNEQYNIIDDRIGQNSSEAKTNNNLK